MQITIANPQKGRQETIEIKFTDRNTPWFDDDIYMITDVEGCLLISERGYSYPVLIYDKSRKDIDYDKHKAYELRRMYE